MGHLKGRQPLCEENPPDWPFLWPLRVKWRWRTIQWQRIEQAMAVEDWEPLENTILGSGERIREPAPEFGVGGSESPE